ncbi:MAG: helix-turn-helix transcriptional regulator [Gaiellaceae bacterium]
MSIPVVGRDSELASVQAFLDELSHGARALLIEGTAGIGKTSLWRAAAELAADRSYRVLRCVGEEAEARLSFVGLGDLFGDVADEALAILPGPQLEAFERALVRHRGTVSRVDARAVGVAVRSLLVVLALQGPVVIAVDDVQWLDGATARTLAFALRRLDGQPVGVLATARTPFVPPDPLGLERAMGPERYANLLLGPLSVGALRAVIEEGLGFQYSRPVLLRIKQVSGGNPLFALELARALGPSPTVEAGAPLPVPESLRELVAARVASLRPEGRRALLTAAALSHPVDRLVEEASSARGLEAVEEAGLLRVDAGRVVFAHPLYASAVYAAAASGRRRAVHARLAELVAEPEEQARHLALAVRPPDNGVAAALDMGAAQARARGAWDAAGELLELASVFTSPEEPEAAAKRGLAAAEHHVHSGDRPRARALLERMLVDAAPGLLRSDALRLLAEIRYNEESFATVPDLLAEALQHTDDAALTIRVELTLAYVYCQNLFDFAAGDRHARQALQHALPLGDGAPLSEALAFNAMVGFLVGRGVDWDAVERSLALEDTGRLLPIHMRPSLIAALLNLYVGRLTEAREQLAVLRTAASDSGDESDLAFVLYWLAYLEIQSGNFEEAVALAEEAVIEAALTGSEVSNQTMAVSLRAFANAHRGEAAKTRVDAAEVVESCATLGLLHPLLIISSALGLLELSLGNPAASWEAARQLTEATESQRIAEPLLHHFLPGALEALVALGELRRAESLLDQFETRAHELDRVWAIATGARCRGLLLAAQGDLDGADQALHHAVAQHARLPMPFELARTLLVHGQIQRRRRQRQAARETLQQAHDLFRDLGSPLWAARTRAELDGLGPGRRDLKLTPAEQRVGELAVAGHSNKEIAAALFVSVHTVELHLSHAYAKLGVRSRTQLAPHFAARANVDKS